MRSVYAGAVGIINALGGEVSMPTNDGRMGWDENLLMYAVREPWQSKSSQAIYGIWSHYPIITHPQVAHE